MSRSEQTKQIMNQINSMFEGAPISKEVMALVAIAQTLVVVLEVLSDIRDALTNEKI